jgi:hypothetical protein
MTDTEFDQALVTAAFGLGAEAGWRKVSPAAAAVRAGLDLAQARARFGACGGILRKFGALADEYALTGALAEGSVRDRLFDTLLRRFDFLQLHRAGVVALLKFLPADPGLAVCLAHATVESMGWLLEAAGVSSTGLRGEMRKRGLALVWGYGVRAWVRDESADLAATMAAVDQALTQADALAARFSGAPRVMAATDLPSPEAPSGVA